MKNVGTTIVTQNGKAVEMPLTSDGKTNFGPGWRKDRATSSPNTGRFVLRIRQHDRCLIKVLENAKTEGGRFLGVYVTPKGLPVEECRGRWFHPTRHPLFLARKSR